MAKKNSIEMRTLAIVFVALEGTLIGLGVVGTFPAHQLAPISIGAGVVFVTIVWIQKARS